MSGIGKKFDTISDLMSVSEPSVQCGRFRYQAQSDIIDYVDRTECSLCFLSESGRRQLVTKRQGELLPCACRGHVSLPAAAVRQHLYIQPPRIGLRFEYLSSFNTL